MVRRLLVGSLLGAALLLLPGINGCPDSGKDQDSDGWTPDQGDCDDLDSSVYPKALEVCDGQDNDCDGVIPPLEEEDDDGDGSLACADCNDDSENQGQNTYPGADEICDARDNNCDGQVDEELPRYTWYFDGDGDGYGHNFVESCYPSNGSYATQISGDCNDYDPTIYPGARDATTDGVDQDCGGHDGQQSSVGLTTSKFTTIQAALDAAYSGDVVWVGPATYNEHDLTYRGKAVTLASIEGPATTIINAKQQGRVLLFANKETKATVLDGFTLTGGVAIDGPDGHGGGIYCSNASPTINRCVISGNVALAGGGVALYDYSSPSFTHVVLSGNQAEDSGGAVYVRPEANFIARNVIISNNSAQYGSAVYMYVGSMTLENVVVDQDSLYITQDAGVYVSNTSFSSVTITLRGVIDGDGDWEAPDVYIGYSNLFMVTLADNGAAMTQTDLTYVDPIYADELYHLASDSPLIDAGDPTIFDPDGSRSDIGAYGGPESTWQ